MSKILKKSIVLILILSLFITDMFFYNLKTYAVTFDAYVKGTGVNIRKGAGTEYDILGQLSTGDKITILKEKKDSSSKIWYQFNYKNQTGYIRADYVYLPKQYVYDEKFENKLLRQNFPEDYKEYLRLLHAEYPNWDFEAFHTGLDFNYAVDMENEGTRSLVTTGAISSYKSTEEGKFDYNTSTWTTFDGKAWVCASKDIIRYYMDPRNFLIDPYVFQFEKQTFDNTVHTLAGVKEMVKGTFLDNKIKTTGLVDKLINNNINNISSNIIDSNAPFTNGPIVSPSSNNVGPGVFPGANIGPGVNITNDNNASVITSPGVNLEPLDQFGNVIPILQNIDDDIMISFANTIYAPGVNVITNTSPVQNVQEEYVESSFYFTYFPAGEYTYSEIIFDACKQVNVNPYVVVSMILQEQGVDGKSDLISGTKDKYKNLYNYGNVGAYVADGKSAVENGLIYANTEGSYNRPWNTKEKGIYGIIDYYAHSFIKRGQDTFYLKKWNVQGDNAFNHQYMTNVLAAASEGQILSKAYSDNMKRSRHVMKIPIYQNLPMERCAKPTKDGNPNNKLKSLSVDGYELTPTFDKNVYNYTLIVDENASKVKVNAEKYHKKASVVGTGNISLNTAITYAIVKVVAENGDIQEYIITIFKKGMLDNPIINTNNNIINEIVVPNVPIVNNINNNIPSNNNVINNINNNQSNYIISPPISSGVTAPGNMTYGILN